MLAEKHSLTLHGHRTSVTLEPEFWQALRGIAAERQLSLNRIIEQIDDARVPSATLASSIRVFCLTHYRDAAEARNRTPAP